MSHNTNNNKAMADQLFANGTVNMAIGGSGQPLFMFHSLLSDRASFNAITPGLLKSFRVFVPELPGFGRSQAVDGGLIEVADRMAQTLREASGASKPVVIGNGYGGFVALQMAISHPDLVDRLVLADCGAAFSEPGRQAFRNMDAAASSKGLSTILDVAMRRLFAPEFQDKNPQLMENRREAFLATKPAVFSQACKALSELDLRPQLGNVKIPALVLVGEQDEATPPPMSQELAAGLPDARLKILPGCAHVPQLQAPDMFLAAIGDFIDTRLIA